MELVDLSTSRSFAQGFPHDFFTWLRREEPVWWHEPTADTPNGVGFWVVSRYDDVVTVFKDAETYSSRLGGTQIFDGKGMGYQLIRLTTPNIAGCSVGEQRLHATDDRAAGRRAAQAGAEHSDNVPIGEVFNFTPMVARELPVQMICSVLGVPQEDRTELIEIVDLAVGAGDGTVMSPEYLKRLSGYADKVVEQKRIAPADDILSIIVHAHWTTDRRSSTIGSCGVFQSCSFRRERRHARIDRGRTARADRVSRRAATSARRSGADEDRDRGNSAMDVAVGLQAAHGNPRHRTARVAVRRL